MSSFPKVATDFDQIIQADRQRRKNEDLAKEIFGRNRQNQSQNKKKDDKRSGRTSTPSLASRVGIAKRSSSTSSNNASPKFQSKPRSSLPGQNARANRISNQLDNETTTNLITSPQPTPVLPPTSNILNSSGISIKGASGPFVLHASNFAPGTTAADIESALHPDTLYNNGVSALVSCKIVSTKPDVVAELVFTEKVVAESIISKYNGQKADGRILQVELVRSGVGSMSKVHNQQAQPQPQAQPQQQNRRDRHPKQQSIQTQPIQPPQEPDVDFDPEIEMPDDSAMEDIEIDATSTAQPALNFNDEREAADRDRRDRDSRRDRDLHYDNKRRGGDDRRRDDRDRERDHDRDRDRERDRDNDRNRDYERRDDRRGGMSSHYGNGVGGGPRGGFGSVSGNSPAGTGGGYSGAPAPSGGYRGGRYGDSGYGGGRGSYRGNYRGFR